MFGIKDIFTTINLLGGVVAICLCIDGEPFYAGISVMLGYLCGDTLDGYVARKLGTSNAFGAEYDTISDHLSHIVAPAAIVYTVYKDVDLLPKPWDQVLAIGLAASIIVVGLDPPRPQHRRAGQRQGRVGGPAALGAGVLGDRLLQRGARARTRPAAGGSGSS